MINKITRELRLMFLTSEQSERGERHTYLDLAKGVAIILVVMGHRGFITEATNAWLSTFHLPVFFLISGIILGERTEDGLYFCPKAVAARRFRSILIPYFWFSVGSLLFDLKNILQGLMEWATLKTHALETVTFRGYSVLWFLPVCFLGEVLYSAFCRIKNKKLRVFVLLISTLAAYFGYQLLRSSCGVSDGVLFVMIDMLKIPVKAFIAACFYSFGSLSTGLLNRLQGRWWGFIGLALLLLMIPGSLYTGICDLNNLQLGCLIPYLVLGYAGGMGLILLCRSVPNIPILSYLGRNSLIIMCTHLNFYVLYYGTIFAMHFGKVIFVSEDFSLNVYTMFFTCLLSLPVIALIRVFLPFVMGERR